MILPVRLAHATQPNTVRKAHAVLLQLQHHAVVGLLAVPTDAAALEAVLQGQADAALVAYQHITPAQLSRAALLPRPDSRTALLSNSPLPHLPTLPIKVLAASPGLAAYWQLAHTYHTVIFKELDAYPLVQALHAGSVDAVLLPLAHLQAAGLQQEPYTLHSNCPSPPATGLWQVVARQQDSPVRDLLYTLHDAPTAALLAAEQEFAAAWQGQGVAALAGYVHQGQLHLFATAQATSQLLSKQLTLGYPWPRGAIARLAAQLAGP